jgi:hypothetical protein
MRLLRLMPSFLPVREVVDWQRLHPIHNTKQQYWALTKPALAGAAGSRVSSLAAARYA